MAREIKGNWIWLRYSYAIAIKASSRMRKLGLTQQQLAERMDCTQQHVSNLLKGKVNMTLETLAKIEQALDFDLIGESLLSFNTGYRMSDGYDQRQAYLNEPAPGEESHLSTKGTVDGYVVKKR
ncbi:MAG: helix-turn-helix transcriptional regulator [Bacteroidales bacterium]|nr:helix-turn-helix transcriptional regulator [Bacteroidales bacterium]